MQRAKRAADGVSFAEHAAGAYRVIAEVQLKMGDTDQARATLRGARRVVEDSGDPWFSPEDLVRIAEAQACAGDGAAARVTLLDACDIASRISSVSMRAYQYSHIAVAQVRVGDREAAAITWKSAERAADQDEGRQTSDYGDIASEMAKVGGAQEVQRILRKMKVDQFECPMARGRVAWAQAIAGDIPGARQTLRLVSDPNDAAYALVEIAAAQARAGDVDGAAATARSLGKDAFIRDVAMRGIATVQADRGDLAGAIATARGIDDPKLLAEAREPIAAGQIRAHDPAARATIAAIAQATHAMDEPRERAETLCAAASLQRACGDPDAARNTLKQALVATEQIVTTDRESNGKWELLGRIATERAALGDFAEAKTTTDALPDSYPADEGRAAACRAIAAAQVAAGDLAGTEQWIQSLKLDYARAFAWVGVAETLSGDSGKR